MNDSAKNRIGNPLTGRSVVVCRATHQAGPLLAAVAATGAAPVHVPLLEVATPRDGGSALHRELSGDAADWLLFTSSNGVDAVFAAGIEPSAKIAVVGSATAARVREIGWEVSFESTNASARSLGESLPATPEQNVVAAVAELASDDLAVALNERSISVSVVTAYRTVTPDVSTAQVEEVMESDAVLVTSPSVIHRLCALAPGAPFPSLIAIGATSAKAIESEGLDVAGIAIDASVDGLIDALLRTIGA